MPFLRQSFRLADGALNLAYLAYLASPPFAIDFPETRAADRGCRGCLRLLSSATLFGFCFSTLFPRHGHA